MGYLMLVIPAGEELAGRFAHESWIAAGGNLVRPRPRELNSTAA
jgi:hypothetical protein